MGMISDAKIELITRILQFVKSRERVEITLSSGEVLKGFIESYDGANLCLSDYRDRTIEISEIISLSADKDIRWEQYLNKLVVIRTQTSGYEGVLISGDDNSVMIVTEEGAKSISFEEIVSIGDKTQDKPKSMQKFSELVKAEGIEPNAFEIALIDADKGTVVKYADTEGMLEELGYGESDIERIRKGLRNATWDKSVYKTATRVFLMQANIHNIAETLYEKSLSAAVPSDGEYAKIINALAVIKAMSDRPQDMVGFFRKYRRYLVNNPNFCSSYANALIKLDDWECLEKEMPVLEKQMADLKGASARIVSALEYHKKTADYKLDNIEELKIRFEELDSDEPEQAKEKDLISKLPQKPALISLLSYYSYIGEGTLFLALFKEFINILKFEKASMKLMLSQMVNSDDISVISLLPEFPVFWCEEIVVRKYLDLVKNEETDSLTDKERALLKIAENVLEYPIPNEFEQAVISDDFDKIRNLIDENAQDLLVMGYSSDEIRELAEIDMDEYIQNAPGNYMLRKIIGFQGNKDRLAERYLAEGYFENKIDVCNRLFPLLLGDRQLGDRRGTLIISLFEYDPSLFENMTSGYRMYYQALCYSASDEVFWNALADNWNRYPDKDIVERLMKIAVAKGDTVRTKKLEMAAKKVQGNAFETALMKAETDEVRRYVIDAKLLIELGYSPEEISKMSRILNSNTTNWGSSNLQKAKRVYLYQKNKNSLAEALFWGLIPPTGKPSNDDAKEASKFLFDICHVQKNYEPVPELYENHIAAEMETNFNGHYAEYYLTALFETGRYREVYDYYLKFIDRWENFNQYILVVISAFKLGIPADDLVGKLFEFRYRPERIAQYIALVVKSKDDSHITELIPKLFNFYCSSFTTQDLMIIKESLGDVSTDGWEIPLSAGLIILKNDCTDVGLVRTWLEFVENEFGPEVKLKAFIRICEAVGEESAPLRECAFEICEAHLPSEEELKDWKGIAQYISSGELGDSDRKRLFSMLSDAIFEGITDVQIFKTAIVLSNECRQIKNFHDVVVGMVEKLKENNSLNGNILGLVQEYYMAAQKTISASEKMDIAKITYLLISEFGFKETEEEFVKNLLTECDISPATLIIGLSVQADEADADGKYAYFDTLMEILEEENDTDVIKGISVWSMDFLLSEDDFDILRTLSNTVKQAVLWNKSELDIICKALFAKPDNSVYWNILGAWAKSSESLKDKVFENIVLNMQINNEKEMEELLILSSKRKIPQAAVKICLKLAGSGTYENSIVCQKALRKMAKAGMQYKELLVTHAKTFIDAVKESVGQNADEEYQWNCVCTALDIARITGELEYFFEKFEPELNGNAVKQNKVVIAEALLLGNTSLVERAFSCIEKSSVPNLYKSLLKEVIDEFHADPSNEVNREILKLISRDYGNKLSVDNYLDLYCELAPSGRADTGLGVIRKLEQHIPEDPALYEFEGSFIGNPKTDEEYRELYMALYTYFLKQRTNVSFTAGRMICGEYYLKKKGIDVPSFEKMVAERYPREKGICMSYEQFCDSISINLRGTAYENYLYAILGAIFKGDWREIFDYPMSDTEAQILMDSFVLARPGGKEGKKTFRISDSYHRSFIKSVVLYFLDSGYEKFREKVPVMKKLWSQLESGTIPYGFDIFVNILKETDSIYYPELKDIWDTDLEMITLFKKKWMGIILSKPGCRNYVNVFSVFNNNRDKDFLSCDDLIKEILENMENEKAIDIARAYEVLFVQPDGYYPNGISVEFCEADYENNAFSDFLKKRCPDYWDYDVRFMRFKNKYKFIKVINGISKISEILKFAGSGREAYFKQRQAEMVFFLRSYFSCLAGMEELEGTVGTEVFLNIVITALSNDTYIAALNEYLKHFDKEHSIAAGILICLAKENYGKMFEKFALLSDGNIRNSLAVRIMWECSKIAADYDNSDLCAEISQKFRDEKKCFWMKFRYVSVKDGSEISHYARGLHNLNEDEYLYPDSDYCISEIPVQVNDAESEAGGGDETDIYPLQENAVAGLNFEKPEFFESNKIVIPEFLKSFLAEPSNDGELEKSRKRMLEIREEINDDSKTRAEFCSLGIRLGISVLNERKDELNHDLMFEVIGLIVPGMETEPWMVQSLHGMFENYVKSFSSIDDLCRSFSEKTKEAEHFRYLYKDCSHGGKSGLTLTAQDNSELVSIVEILSWISYDMESQDDSEVLKGKLSRYKNLILAKNVMRFKEIVNYVSELMQKKISRLSEVPKIIIYHSGNVDIGTNVCDWNEEWTVDVEGSYVRGILLNHGGAEARDLSLDVFVDGVKSKTFRIDRVSPGEKLSFKVAFEKAKIKDGEVMWSAACSYYDTEGDKKTSQAAGRIAITLLQEEWSGKNIGREYFILGKPAEDDSFIGRQKELRTLRELFSEGMEPKMYPSMVVKGLRRVGKSSVLVNFRKELNKRDNVAAIYFEASLLDTADAFVFKVMEGLEEKEILGKITGNLSEFRREWEDLDRRENWYKYLPSFYRALSGLLGGRKVIIILDEMERVFFGGKLGGKDDEEAFLGILRSMVQTSGEYVSFVFCGSDLLLINSIEKKRESQIFQNLESLFVGRMSKSDICLVFKAYNDTHRIKFDEEAIDEIMRYTGGLVWYAKIIAYHVLFDIINEEEIYRESVHISDIHDMVEELVNGSFGSELVDLLDVNFSPQGRAVIHAMGSIARDKNISVSARQISEELSNLGYIDDKTGEAITSLGEQEILNKLDELEKIGFLEKDRFKGDSYFFATEIYRIRMSPNQSIHQLKYE